MSIDKLTTLQIFKHLSPMQIRQLVADMDLQISHFKKGTIIHFDEDCCTAVDIVISGKVSIDRIDERGNLLTVSLLEKDSLLGGNLLFSSQPYYPMTLTAATDVALLTIRRVPFFELIANDRLILQLVLNVISDQALTLGNKIKYHVKRTIEDVLLTFIKHEVVRQQSMIITIGSTKKALAERLGVQRTSLSRAMQKMKDAGLIDYTRTTITYLSDELL